ncbi:MAG: non-proteolytic archaemetzincin-like protein [Myxococcota bacterium]
MSKLLQLVTVGSAPAALLKDLEEPLAMQLGVSAVPGKTPLQAPAYAFNKDRQQYHSNAIMRRLVPLIEPGQSFVLALADVDLFVPDSSFVFGEADRESKVAVLSLFRLKHPSPDGLRRRAQVEAVHQAGHLVGLSYCDDPRCVMFLATSPADCDRKGLALCNVCRNELAKLNR